MLYFHFNFRSGEGVRQPTNQTETETFGREFIFLKNHSQENVAELMKYFNTFSLNGSNNAKLSILIWNPFFALL